MKTAEELYKKGLDLSDFQHYPDGLLGFDEFKAVLELHDAEIKEEAMSKKEFEEIMLVHFNTYNLNDIENWRKGVDDVWGRIEENYISKTEIKSLLKKQRENCKLEFELTNSPNSIYAPERTSTLPLCRVNPSRAGGGSV